MSSEEYKQKGNDAFRLKNFPEAIEHFTKAIELDGSNHVLFSNRSACYASLHKYLDALKDAEKCVQINPSWAKGYNRVAAAEFGLGDFDEAKKAYEEALRLDPANAMAKEGLNSVQDAKTRGQGGDAGAMSDMFSKLTDPMLVEKLKANPKTAQMMTDSGLVQKVRNMQSNPQSVAQDMMTDPRLMTVITTILGVDLERDPNVGSNEAPETVHKTFDEDVNMTESTPASTPASAPAPKKQEPKQEPEPEVDDAKSKADAFKAEANKLYKARKFDEAIELYNKAWETCKDITYLNNRAAAEFEKSDYETAIATCKLAIDEGREMRANYTLIAKSFARIGNCYVKKNELSLAIENFQKSLTEHRTADTLNKLRAAEKELKKQEQESYIDEEKSEEARLKGKDYFTQGDWPNAVKEYSEMIKRNPSDPRGYSNRAAALAKLMSFPDAVSDCNKAIKLDPKFIRAYIRKAHAQMAMKEYKACADTLQEAQEIEKNNNASPAQLAEIEQMFQKALSQRFAPLDGETYEQTMERIQKDPEVVEILQDPVMNTILQQAQNNPQALQEHMKNPDVYKKVMILMSAGIIRTR
ncbi:Hsp90 cochaperone [Martiniozyma asiatica (nom. inval.)]|nr:Hsp90 cochaperone [Martiniozyma asiatica]